MRARKDFSQGFRGLWAAANAWGILDVPNSRTGGMYSWDDEVLSVALSTISARQTCSSKTDVIAEHNQLVQSLLHGRATTSYDDEQITLTPENTLVTCDTTAWRRHVDVLKHPSSTV